MLFTRLNCLHVAFQIAPGTLLLNGSESKILDYFLIKKLSYRLVAWGKKFWWHFGLTIYHQIFTVKFLNVNWEGKSAINVSRSTPNVYWRKFWLAGAFLSDTSLRFSIYFITSYSLVTSYWKYLGHWGYSLLLRNIHRRTFWPKSQC